MRFPFFGKRDNEPEPEEERAKNVIVPTEGNEIVPTLDSEDVDLALYDHVPSMSGQSVERHTPTP